MAPSTAENNAPPNHLIYADHPVQTQYKQTRLIVLLPGTWDDPIKCNLKVVQLENTNCDKYEALSYHWGERDQDKTIEVHDHQFMATKSLFTALRRFRYPDRERLLWADAISINQAYTPERNEQVGIMMEVYSQCTKVLVWLGECSEQNHHHRVESTWVMEDLFEESINLEGSNTISPPETISPNQEKVDKFTQEFIRYYNRPKALRHGVPMATEFEFGAFCLLYCLATDHHLKPGRQNREIGFFLAHNTREKLFAPLQISWINHGGLVSGLCKNWYALQKSRSATTNFLLHGKCSRKPHYTTKNTSNPVVRDSTPNLMNKSSQVSLSFHGPSSIQTTGGIFGKMTRAVASA
jgi:hypothetical protein